MTNIIRQLRLSFLVPNICSAVKLSLQSKQERRDIMVVYVFGLPSPKDVYKRAKDKIRKQKKDKEKKAEKGPVATTA